MTGVGIRAPPTECHCPTKNPSMIPAWPLARDGYCLFRWFIHCVSSWVLKKEMYPD